MRFVQAMIAAAALLGAGAATAAAPTLAFTTFAHTDLPLGQVVWTGNAFLYLPENLAQVETADASGGKARPFAVFPGGLGARRSGARCR